MSKNIEMNVLNSDGSYEVLYPYTVPSQVEDLLNNDTKVYIGLDESATPDDAFRQLFLANVLQGKSALRITLQNQDGIKMGGVTITSEQFCDSKGNKTHSMTTNDEGIIDTFVDAESTTVNINGYFEIANTNTTWSTPLGEQLEETWTITTRNELTITTTSNYSFSHNVKTFDVCLVGGGGGGGSGSYLRNGVGCGGAGGGGGYVTNYFSNSIIEGIYSIIIGAGGAGAQGTLYGGYGAGRTGGNGGQTLITKEGLNLYANGGNGGQGGVNGNGTSLGGEGNGKGGNSYCQSTPSYSATWDNGENATVYKFNDSNLGIAGGGGGGGSGNGYSNGNPPVNPVGGTGGNPYGGTGGALAAGTSSMWYGYGGENGKGYGGGGGGGTGCAIDNSRFYGVGTGGTGGPGVAFLRWTVQEVSA